MTSEVERIKKRTRKYIRNFYTKLSPSGAAVASDVLLQEIVTAVVVHEATDWGECPHFFKDNPCIKRELKGLVKRCKYIAKSFGGDFDEMRDEMESNFAREEAKESLKEASNPAGN